MYFRNEEFNIVKAIEKNGISNRDRKVGTRLYYYRLSICCYYG